MAALFFLVGGRKQGGLCLYLFEKKSNLLDKTENNQELYFFCGHDNMLVRFLKEGRIA